MSDAFESIKAGLEQAIAHQANKPNEVVVHEMSATDVKAVRDKVGMTQREFAASFERAPRAEERFDEYLRFELCGLSWACRLASLSLVTSCRGRLCRAPGTHAAFVGVLAVGSRVAPAYDLAALAGLDGRSARAWALVTVEPAVALLVDRCHGLVRRPTSADGSARPPDEGFAFQVDGDSVGVLGRGQLLGGARGPDASREGERT